jgi:hypothetical protein
MVVESALDVVYLPGLFFLLPYSSCVLFYCIVARFNIICSLLSLPIAEIVFFKVNLLNQLTKSCRGVFVSFREMIVFELHLESAKNQKYMHIILYQPLCVQYVDFRVLKAKRSCRHTYKGTVYIRILSPPLSYQYRKFFTNLKFINKRVKLNSTALAVILRPVNLTSDRKYLA